jgi:hypothetical protein
MPAAPPRSAERVGRRERAINKRSGRGMGGVTEQVLLLAKPAPVKLCRSSRQNSANRLIAVNGLHGYMSDRIAFQ